MQDRKRGGAQDNAAKCESDDTARIEVDGFRTRALVKGKQRKTKEKQRGQAAKTQKQKENRKGG